ncbi:hypothetical protein B9Z55_013685 [Caenorhabditis nigoni]|uniref:Uncharacterized protein n=1 Tax=Caenorhabditis nigoni TaxID=1611254 RepID=A0A2G5U2T8_9PELO|nr:hypothetical protein B9Z55_013685 [Caenorhabditis nigoni]
MPVTPAALMMSDTFMQTKRGDARTAGPTSRTSRTVSKAEIGTIRIMTTCAAEEKERKSLMPVPPAALMTSDTFKQIHRGSGCHWTGHIESASSFQNFLNFLFFCDFFFLFCARFILRLSVMLLEFDVFCPRFFRCPSGSKMHGQSVVRCPLNKFFVFTRKIKYSVSERMTLGWWMSSITNFRS